MQQSLATMTRALERASGFVPPPPGVRVEWRERVDSVVEDAYAAVGGEAWVPLDLVGTLMATPGPHRKRVAVLYRDDVPWAVVPLRRAGYFWEPLLQGVIPELPLFACAGDRRAVFAALRVNVGCWASPEDPRGWTNLRWSESLACYELDVSSDPHEYWRKSGLRKTLNRIKRETSAMEVVTDDPDGAAWTIRNWRDLHSVKSTADVTSKWRDRLAAAEWGLPRGMMHCWNVRHEGQWVAGLTGFVRDGRLSSGSIYRDRRYDWFGVGNRTWYEFFLWAHTNGLRTASMGGEFEYKKFWAPPVGTHWRFVVAPLPVHAMNGVRERSREAALATKGLVGRRVPRLHNAENAKIKPGVSVSAAAHGDGEP